MGVIGRRRELELWGGSNPLAAAFDSKGVWLAYESDVLVFAREGVKEVRPANNGDVLVLSREEPTGLTDVAWTPTRLEIGG